MKKLLIILFVAVTSLSYGQSGIVILTEEFTIAAPWTATVHITLANGTSTSTPITAENTSVAQHETDLNNLINTITSQGYQIITAPSGWGCYGCIANSGLRRIFFGIPWTTKVDELTMSSDLKNELRIYPNPVQNEINIQIDKRVPIGWSFYIVDINGLIVFKENESIIDISVLSNGSYMLYAVKENEYLDGIRFIKH